MPPVPPGFYPGTKPDPANPLKIDRGNIVVRGGFDDETLHSAKLQKFPNYLDSSGNQFPRQLESYRERWDQASGEQQLVTSWVLPWGKAAEFRQYMLGYPTNAQAGPTKFDRILRREIPMPVPLAGYRHLYCSSCEVTGGQGIWLQDPNARTLIPNQGPLSFQKTPWMAFFDQNTSADGLATMTTTFSQRRYIMRTDLELDTMVAQASTPELERYVERYKKNAIQSMPLPTASLPKFVTGPAANQSLPTSAANLLIPTQELQYTWWEVPNIFETNIDLCVGKVNEKQFDGAKSRKSYNPETLLCQAPLDRTEYHSVTGEVVWKITYSFLFRPNGWNFFPAGDGSYNLVTDDGTAGGNRIFKTANFDLLFIVGPPNVYQ